MHGAFALRVCDRNGHADIKPVPARIRWQTGDDRLRHPPVALSGLVYSGGALADSGGAAAALPVCSGVEVSGAERMRRAPSWYVIYAQAHWSRTSARFWKPVS